MSARWERRDVLKALAAGSACAALGSGRRSVRGSESDAHHPKRPDHDARSGASEASAVAIADGRFIAVGDDAEILQPAVSDSQVIDVGGRRVIPGLMDSHTHVIRGGLNYNLELRWDGVPSLADAMRLLREQARRTPPPHWVRVVGGFSESQFAEKRLPTLAELNAAAPDTPVFILRLYDRALLNRAALRAVGYTKDTPDPPGSRHRARQERGTDGDAGRETERGASLRDARQGTEALARGPDEFDAPLHAGAQPARRDLGDRCRGRLSELPARLRSGRAARARGPAHGANRLQPLPAEAEGRARGLPGLGDAS